MLGAYSRVFRVKRTVLSQVCRHCEPIFCKANRMSSQSLKIVLTDKPEYLINRIVGLIEKHPYAGLRQHVAVISNAPCQDDREAASQVLPYFYRAGNVVDSGVVAH